VPGVLRVALPLGCRPLGLDDLVNSDIAPALSHRRLLHGPGLRLHHLRLPLCALGQLWCTLGPLRRTLCPLRGTLCPLRGTFGLLLCRTGLRFRCLGLLLGDFRLELLGDLELLLELGLLCLELGNLIPEGLDLDFQLLDPIPQERLLRGRDLLGLLLPDRRGLLCSGLLCSELLIGLLLELRRQG
jgi:hypothetical protein